MKLIYNILFLIFFIFTAPYYFWRLWRRGNWGKNFTQRFGHYSKSIRDSVKGKRVIWFHAVSVGEVNLCVQLILRFTKRCPQYQILASTTTTTGMAELEKKLPVSITKIYYPIDWIGSVRKALKAFHPEAIVLIEAEIWPNFLWESSGRKIPLYLFNTRLSDRSFRRYLKAKFIFQNIFRNFRAMGVQDQNDKEHLLALGAHEDAIIITGNLKFDGASLALDNKLDVRSMLDKLGIPKDAPILVAGSTHAGEEVLLAEMALRLKRQFPDFFLVLVPRHFERCKSIVPELKGTGISFVLRSELENTSLKKTDCILVNSTGELRYFYGVATLAFIGKSITAKGGQNPIEPAALGKPVLFGPNMQNFTSIVHTFIKNDAVVQVANIQELEKQIVLLLKDPKRCHTLGENARATVIQNQGGVDRSVEILCTTLHSS